MVLWWILLTWELEVSWSGCFVLLMLHAVVTGTHSVFFQWSQVTIMFLVCEISVCLP